MSKYLTAPVPTEKLPRGVPFIICNDVAERFSFYGMRAILVVFMTRYLMDGQGGLDTMGNAEATEYFHRFTAAVYFLPLIGAFISDALLGKYRTILLLSLVYCGGHLSLALDDTRFGLFLGLTLIAIGSGGIKPCVGAHVGDQFGASNQHLLSRVFSWFYLGINVGSALSSVLTPFLLDRYGPNVAFGVPGVFMLLATIVFWAGRHKFIHIPPTGRQYVRDLAGRDGLKVLFKLGPIYLFVAAFWSLFDQTGSTWVLQAEQMDRVVFGRELLSSQIQAVNPFLILILIPVFSYGIYPFVGRFARVTEMRKMTVGMFLTVTPFLVSAWIEGRIQAGETPHIGWQLLAYLLLTCAEVMVSITCMEMSYTQAPKRMKSLVMALFYLSISMGNLFTSGVNHFIQNPDGSTKLEGASYHLFFVAVMLGTSILFAVYGFFFREERIIQDESPVLEEPNPSGRE